MGLLQNISLRNAEPYVRVGDTTEMITSQLSRSINKYTGESGMNMLYGVPIGNLHPTAWFLPMKVGGMASLSGSVGIGNIASSAIAGGRALSTTRINGTGGFNVINISALADIASVSKINGMGEFATNPIIIGGINAVCNIYGLGNISDADIWDGISIVDLVAALSGNSSTSFDIYAAINMYSDIDGLGSLAADVQAILQRNLVANIQNSGSLVSDIQAIANMVIEINASSSVTGDFSAKANLTAAISPFTELSPESLAASVWNSIAAQFNASGTMGNKLNGAGSAGDPWGASLPNGYLSTEAGGILSQIHTLVDELHRIQGLKSGEPMTVTQDSRVSGDIELEITGDGETTTTVTRI